MADKDIDLTPRDYRVTKGKDTQRKEPFFQPGGLAFLIAYFVVGMVVLMAWISFKDWLLGR